MLVIPEVRFYCFVCGIEIIRKPNASGPKPTLCIPHRIAKNRELSKQMKREYLAKKRFPKSGRYDYKRANALLKTRPIREVARMTNIPYSTLHRNRSTEKEKVALVETREPLIMPADRPQIAREAYRKRMGMDEATFQRIVVPGAEFKRWESQCGFR